MTTRTITAMFDSSAEAERAVEALVNTVSISRSAIRMNAPTSTDGSEIPEEKGFFAGLRDLFVPDEDRHAYTEGLRRGSVLVSATINETQVDSAMDVLEQHGAVDLDQREAEWRQSGWTGTSGTVAAGTGTVVGAVSDGNRTAMAAVPGNGERGVGSTGAATTQSAAAGSPQGEESIPIVEEQLRVGKRKVDRGRVRVRSYIVETPVQEQVTLHKEHVDVERHAVDRPAANTEALFQERTIEATESAEEVVVSKEVRVKEELVISKEAEEQVQTVRDTVRRTEVEIDDDRPAASTTPAGTPTSNPRMPDLDRS